MLVGLVKPYETSSFRCQPEFVKLCLPTYPLVTEESYGQSPFLLVKITIHGNFQVRKVLVYQRVPIVWGHSLEPNLGKLVKDPDG